MKRRTAHLLALAFLHAPAAAQEPGAPPPPPAPAGEEEEPPRGLVSSAEGACEGYTLFAPLRSRTTYLVDMRGELVHTWASDHTPGNSVYLLEDGSILRAANWGPDSPFSAGGEGGRVQRIAWDGTLLWDFAWADERHRQHHDIALLPSGNVLLISWEHKTAEEAIAAGRDPEEVGERGLWPDALFEIRPAPPTGGEVVWEWHAWDHLIQDHDPERANHGDVTAHPELLDLNADHRRAAPMSAAERRRQAELEQRMRALGYVGDDDEEEDEGAGEVEGGADRGRGPGGDWLHLNSVDYEPALDLVIVSSHTLSEVWVIDHSTTTEEAAGHSGGRYGKGGDLLWRWGNPRNYGAAGERQLFRQHDARFLERGEDGALRVLVFNNGQGRPGGEWSSVDELVLPFEPGRGFAREPGAAFGPAAPDWSYAAPERERFYASFISGAERLPNGDTLICSGPEGRVFEVTRAGEVVWDYLMPFPGEERGGERGPGGPDGRGPRGGPPRGERPAGPPDGPPGPPTGPPGRGPRGDRGGPPRLTYGLFRATRIAPDHLGLGRL